MIVLPSLRLAYLRSFSLGLALLNVCIACILARRFPAQLHRLPLGLLFVSLPLIGLFQPAWMKGPYTFWNSAATFFGRVARVVLTGICFYVVFLAVGRAGSRMDLARPREKSLWNPKRTLCAAAFTREFVGDESTVAGRGWIGGYSSWAWNSGQIWALFLLPFLLILSALDSSQDSRVPDGMYTLF